MNSTRRVILASMCVILAAACIGVRAVDPRVRETTKDSPRIAKLPLREYALPYNGYGSVVLINTGALLIRLGGGSIASVDEHGEEVEEFTPRETVAIDLDTTGLTLVEHNGVVFLDRDGSELARKGLESNVVFRTVFPNREFTERISPPCSIVEFAGELSIRSSSANIIELEIKDTDASGRTFQFSTNLRTGVAQNKSLESPPQQTEGSVADAGSSGSSACSIVCSRGASNVTCQNMGCRCYCSSGRPICECINSTN